MAYTDLTDSFSYNTKALWTDFNALAVNANAAYSGLNNPLFSAYNASTFNTDGSGGGNFVKVPYDTEEWDPNNVYDTVNYRFTPGVAGRYLLVAAVTYGGSAAYANFFTLIFGLNGSTAITGAEYNPWVAKEMTMGATAIVSAGATDYYEVSVLSLNTKSMNAGPTGSYFQGFRLVSDL